MEDSDTEGSWLCSWENWVLQQSRENADEGDQQKSCDGKELLNYGQNPNIESVDGETPQSHIQACTADRQYPKQDAPQVSIKDKRLSPWSTAWNQPDVSKKRASVGARPEKFVSSKQKP